MRWVRIPSARPGDLHAHEHDRTPDEAFRGARGACVLRYHELKGVGPTCVFLHGLGLDSTSLLVRASHPVLRGLPVSGEGGGGLVGARIERVVVPDAGHIMIDDSVDAVARVVARSLA